MLTTYDPPPLQKSSVADQATMNVLIASPSAELACSWAEAIGQADSALRVCVAAGSAAQAECAAAENLPDLLVMHLTRCEDFDALERMLQLQAALEVVLVLECLPSQLLYRAIQAGISEVLQMGSADAIEVAVSVTVVRLARKRFPAAELPSRHADVIGVLSGRGGAGATFVAVNLAHILAANGHGARRVALIDLNPQFADAALLLSQGRAPCSVAQLAALGRHVQGKELLNAMTQAAPGLWLLAGSEGTRHASDVTQSDVQGILEAAAESFDFVVIDLGRSINAQSMAALNRCDRVYTVLQQTLSCVRDACHLNALYRSLGYNVRKINWIVNRYERAGPIGLDELKRMLSGSSFVTLPSDPEIAAASANQGIPVAQLAAGSAITQALERFAGSIAPP